MFIVKFASSVNGAVIGRYPSEGNAYGAIYALLEEHYGDAPGDIPAAAINEYTVTAVNE